MKKIKRTLIHASGIIVLVLSLTACAQAAADTAGVPSEHKHHEGKEDFIKTLNLTKEQQDKLEKQHEADTQSSKELKDKLKTKRAELQQELQKPEIDKNKIKTIIGEINALMAEQFTRRIDDLISMKQILTPDQFKKMLEQKHHN